MRPILRYSKLPSHLRKLAFSSVLCISAYSAQAYKHPFGKSNEDVKKDKAVTAGCLNPEASASLELNNVRALIHSGGDMWWDLQKFARYEIPKGSGKNSLYLGSLWMGGVDGSGNLKVAAQLYREKGTDFYTGPLDTLGTADIDAQTCKEFDRLWKVSRAEVALFRECYRHPKPDCPPVPESIKNWPAIVLRPNDPALSGGQPSVQYHYAPFIDVNGDSHYNPDDGDYPGYDLDNSADCQSNRTPYLYGDETIFWIFNDKGNSHYETSSNGIGLEVRAQAFAFATNDEINNMTFYNYEIINRATSDLYNCYFGVNTDADLGYAMDDYVGCDVMRGFGYLYNADAIDAPGNTPAPDHYGANPPAVGIDFFEGPYADPNNKADVFDLSDPDTWLALNGLGYNDAVVDNERIGMRRFVYYQADQTAVGQPTVGKAIQFYNLLNGRWRTNPRMVFGGSGYPGAIGATGLEADFMFPGDSDPYNWGTKGVPPGFEWTQKNPCPTCEEAPGADRRFVQSAGPFTLKAGAVNDITTGAVWARAYSGDPFESVQLVRKADDKAQRLFENCFRILDGPHAPEVGIQELDRELILYWTNSPGGNNKNNTYQETDYAIDTILVPNKEDRKYKFQGFLVYQVTGPTVTADERHDLNKARLIAQCDLKDFDATGNPIATLINYNVDVQLGYAMPQVEVQGSNQGITQSLRVLEDAFATGADKRLVNHKKYHFLVLAYAYNNYKKYDQNDPQALDGQKKPFLASRKSAFGPISVSAGIPHITAPESYGTLLNSFYGDGPEITRIEGNGNGSNVLDITAASELSLLQPPYYSDHITYQRGKGPVKIKVVDPLSIKKGSYYLAFNGPVDVLGSLNTLRTSGSWVLLDEDKDTVAVSQNDLSFNTEQLVFDKKTGEFLGISIVISQVKQPGDDREANNGLLETTLEMKNPSDVYLGFIPDDDIIPALNWILSGSQTLSLPGILPDFDPNPDKSQSYERAALGTGGSLAPVALASYGPDAPGWISPTALGNPKMEFLQSVDLVLTPDKSKWTRVPIFETSGDVSQTYSHPDLVDALHLRPRKLDLRRSPSVDKNGRYSTEDGTLTGKLLTSVSSNPEDANYISEWGMGWFPGYAISLETGERLNMAFGEDSHLAFANGRDMLFNPLGVNMNTMLNNPQIIADLGDAVLAGKHFVYIFGSQAQQSMFEATPRYDAGAWAMAKLKEAEAKLDDVSLAENVRQKNSNKVKAQLIRAAMWTGMPVAIQGKPWLSDELRVRMRVGKPYMKYSTYGHQQPSVLQNDNKPLYHFSLDELAPEEGNRGVAMSALDLINVVPNPYYAYSAYEVNQLDNRVKITNLPPTCSITIYNVSGTLIRRFHKADNQITSVDWDLTNFANIPVAGGIYLIHVKVPNMGERVIKWFGVLRPTDASDF